MLFCFNVCEPIAGTHQAFIISQTCMVFIYIFRLSIFQAHNRPFQFPSLTSHGVYVYDDFSRCLIADLLVDLLNSLCFLSMQAAPSSSLLHFLSENNTLDLIIKSTGPSRLLPCAVSTFCSSLSACWKTLTPHPSANPSFISLEK